MSVLVAGIALGLLIGYERWGSTAALVSIVEKELAASQAHINMLEKKMAVVEAKLGIENVGKLTQEPEAAATEKAGLR
jgi:hypothetical protein